MDCNGMYILCKSENIRTVDPWALGQVPCLEKKSRRWFSTVPKIIRHCHGIFTSFPSEPESCFEAFLRGSIFASQQLSDSKVPHGSTTSQLLQRVAHITGCNQWLQPVAHIITGFWVQKVAPVTASTV